MFAPPYYQFLNFILNKIGNREYKAKWLFILIVGWVRGERVLSREYNRKKTTVKIRKTATKTHDPNFNSI